MDDYAVVTEELTKKFGDFTAVDHVTFRVRRGEIFGFLGPNGAGKTTTIRMLLGLVRPTSGQATVLGHDIVRETALVKRRIGYMSQRFSLYNDLKVDENLNFYGRTYGVRGRRLEERKAFVLKLAGLQGREMELASNLAGGWRQRLALGAALLHEPEMLFLDEPTAGVDPVSRREFWDLLYDLAAGGTTIFVTTHYMDEAEHCQDLAFILHGRVVAQGSPQEIKYTQMRGQVLEINCDAPERAIRVLREQNGFDEVALYGSLVHVVAETVRDQMPAIERNLREAGIQVRSLDIIVPSLEDVFISSVKDRST
jgi:ABC-2 type transport system ATP-binding protein